MNAVLDALGRLPATAPARSAAAAGPDLPEERRILERCAREIALEAGGGARVVELGGHAGSGAGLLKAAIAALRQPPAAPQARRLVFLSGRRTSAMTDRQLAATLRRVGRSSSGDALLVVGAPSRQPGALARFDRLASAAAWEHRQLWSDGGAAFAVHVLARRAACTRSTDM